MTYSGWSRPQYTPIPARAPRFPLAEQHPSVYTTTESPEKPPAKSSPFHLTMVKLTTLIFGLLIRFWFQFKISIISNKTIVHTIVTHIRKSITTGCSCLWQWDLNEFHSFRTGRSFIFRVLMGSFTSKWYSHWGIRHISRRQDLIVTSLNANKK